MPEAKSDRSPGPGRPPDSERRTPGRLVEAGLLALLVWTPLPIASVEAWAVLVLEIAVLALVSAHLFDPHRPVLPSPLAARLRVPRLAFLGLSVFLVFQIIPWPVSLTRALSPQSAALRERFVPGAGAARAATLSLVPGRTLAEGLELLAYVLVGVLVLLTVRHRSQIRRFMSVLVAMGLFEAAYGLFELTRTHPRLLFYDKVYGLDSVSGTFVNRNHFAGYLGMIIPLALGLLLARLEIFGEPGTSWKTRFARFLNRNPAQAILPGAGVLLMTVALLLSNSRSGIVVLFLTLAVVAALASVHFGSARLQSRKARLFLKIGAAVFLLVLLIFGTEAMIARFALDDLLQDDRPQYWGAVLEMVRDFPLFGVGFGAFGEVYRAYDTTGMEYDLVHAHNDYLEFLTELGVPGFLLLAVGVGGLILAAFRTWASRRHPEVKALALGGLASLSALLLHSLTDFNLHIPANALVFTVVLCLTVRTVFHGKA